MSHLPAFHTYQIREGKKQGGYVDFRDSAARSKRAISRAGGHSNWDRHREKPAAAVSSICTRVGIEHATLFADILGHGQSMDADYQLELDITPLTTNLIMNSTDSTR
jgi:hypothetical protein